jgi:hypothetical protein
LGHARAGERVEIVLANGRAHGTEHIELLEIGSLPGEAIKMRRFEPGMSVAGEITPAPVVSEDENDIELRGGCWRGDQCRERAKHETQ